MGTLIVNANTGIIVHIQFDSQPANTATAISSEGHYFTGDYSIGNQIIIDVVDCRGMILSPGFIDLQLNGAYGVDFSNCGSDDYDYGDCDDGNISDSGINDVFRVANSLCQTGVTSFCPTMVSSSRETYRRVLPIISRARLRQQQQQLQQVVGANILGMHLEGPFFDSSKRGAHDERHILAPSKGIATVREVYGLNDSSTLKDIDIITLAPELDGALAATKALTSSSTDIGEHSVVVSCGHTGATYEEGIRAIEHGATLLTHLFNAMNPFHHRNPGLVGLLSSEAKLGNIGLQRPFYSLIVDGLHVHESAVGMAYSSHPDGCVLVTDAISAMGLGDGTHSLGNMTVNIKGDRATLTGTDTLAGSVVSMNLCVRRFQRFTGCTVGKALLCATLHPAKVLNRDVVGENCGVVEAPIGVLEVGARADLVLVTDRLDIAATWVYGRLAYDGLKIL